MEFSAEMFAQVVASLDPTELRRPKTEKRRADRVPLRFAVRITPWQEGGNGPAVLGTLRDISPRGTCLESKMAMAAGSQLLLHLPSQSGRTTVNVLCTVVYCKTVRHDRYLIGAELTCVLDPEEKTDEAAKLERIRQSILL